MVNDLIHGMSHFSEHFEGFEKDYIIIGGIATALNQRRFGATSKATHDFDLIVLDESTESAFVSHFIDYVKNKARYQFIGAYKQEGRILYQFSKPSSKSAPEMIELFTINELKDDKLTYERLHGAQHYEYISAIVLDKEYRALVEHYRIENSNLSIAAPEALIVLKALAYVNYINAGDTRGAKKHLDDIKSLAGFIEDEDVKVSENIFANICIVADELMKIRGKEELATLLKEVYIAEQ